MDTHMETGMKEYLQLMERHAAVLKCEKESADAIFNLFISATSKNLEFHEFQKRNCVYTDSLWNGRYKTCVFSPPYGPGYRIQMWIPIPSSSGQMAITLGVLAPRLFGDDGLTWPLKVIITIELIDPIGRLDPISQSKRCIFDEPTCHREPSAVTFDPFVPWEKCKLYAQGRDEKMTFNIYLCQPGRHPDDHSNYNNY